MGYTLHRLAAGSYDLLLNEQVIGSFVRNISASGNPKSWRVELLEDLSPEQRPEPFTKAKHTFKTFNAAWKWLGDPEVTQDLNGRSAAADLKPVRAQLRRA